MIPRFSISSTSSDIVCLIEWDTTYGGCRTDIQWILYYSTVVEPRRWVKIRVKEHVSSSNSRRCSVEAHQQTSSHPLSLCYPSHQLQVRLHSHVQLLPSSSSSITVRLAPYTGHGHRPCVFHR
ncbi:hypothetical protein PoB_004035300 [Plakobranchus ocellatus]|uniref:Uncharacterized protein n=1 Tax=Plakobranchus ocellatus TaxID=259542 RepID=A0AAV4B413_9GAST|nr:hypothetical protein PoB_004035300 [Plakobranchus ocellatus]